MEEGRILILRDHVIEDMLIGLGATVRHVREPFQPVRGAYHSGGHGHAHGHHTTERRHTTALIRLMTWLSPAFPIGAFAYSGGLERAIADGRIRDRDGLHAWLDGLWRMARWKTDAIFLLVELPRLWRSGAFRNQRSGSGTRGSAERLSETVSLGTALSMPRATGRIRCFRRCGHVLMAALPIRWQRRDAGAHETGWRRGLPLISMPLSASLCRSPFAAA